MGLKYPIHGFEENLIAVSLFKSNYCVYCSCQTEFTLNIIHPTAALWYGKEDSQKDKSLDNSLLDSETDVDDEDGDSEVEGSADQSLEF